MPYQPKDPTAATVQANQRAGDGYPMQDRRDYELADRGLIARIPGHQILLDDGSVSVDLSSFDFLRPDDKTTPDSVNPSLWRQSQLMRKDGLFKVSDGIYQVRNMDIAGVTFIEGEKGLVVVDCSMSVEAARVSLAMMHEHVTDKPVSAVIYTHTHIDHYGGVKGLVSADDVASGKIPIVAPGTIASFDKYAIGENVIAGNAMSRRTMYAFGSVLDTDPQQMLTCGIGTTTGKGLTVSYISPTDGITKTGSKRELAGIEFEFLYAPDTEAPEEMHIWIPELKALTCAENCQHSLHNIQTLRGARTRDARNFARYLDETLERWGDEAEVLYGPHTWPTWGNAELTELISSQRDTYKYIHDQALRLANQGYTPIEAAEVITLPEALDSNWANHGYHGTVHHNVRAVFHKELGLWDGDPASIHPHPREESAKRWTNLVGADTLIAEGRRAFEQADYRWAVEVLHKVVFDDPDNQVARELQADAYEQMGYQAEGPQWRGIFLAAARELRQGVLPAVFATASSDSILAMPIDILFDFAAVHVKGPEAAEVDLRIDFHFTDADETWTVWVRRGVLNARRGASSETQLTVSGPKPALVGLALGQADPAELAKSGAVTLDGESSVLDTYRALMDTFDPNYNLITP